MDIVEHKYKTTNALSKRKKTEEIVIHCTATKEGVDFDVDKIDRSHKARNFSCIGYHYVIYRDGSIHRGRPEDTVGAHTSGRNSVSIGICYVGGLDKNGKNKDTRTTEQETSMILLVKYLLNKYKDIKLVSGHYNWARKGCPCFDVSEWLDIINLSKYKNDKIKYL